jgi:hypothetical protein
MRSVTINNITYRLELGYTHDGKREFIGVWRFGDHAGVIRTANTKPTLSTRNNLVQHDRRTPVQQFVDQLVNAVWLSVESELEKRGECGAVSERLDELVAPSAARTALEKEIQTLIKEQ